MPSQYEFADFVPSVQGKDPLDISGLADHEATRVERCCHRIGASGSRNGRCPAIYARELKGLIYYLRYGAKPPGTDPKSFKLMRTIGTEDG